MAEEKFEQALTKKLTDTSDQPEEILWSHWRELLNQHNYARLNETSISDTEFLRLRDTINAFQTPYDTQSVLSGSGSLSTIPLLRDTGDKVDLEIFYLNDVGGSKSVYEVVRQITFDRLSSTLAANRRADLFLLINGLPVGYIEEKDEVLQNQWGAFEQLKKYAGDGISLEDAQALYDVYNLAVKGPVGNVALKKVIQQLNLKYGKLMCAAQTFGHNIKSFFKNL